MADIDINNLIALDKSKLVQGQRIIKIGSNIFLPVGLGGNTPPKRQTNVLFQGKETKMLDKTNFSYFSGMVSTNNDADIKMAVETPIVYLVGEYKNEDKIFVNSKNFEISYLVLSGSSNIKVNGEYFLTDNELTGDNRIWSNGDYYICKSADTSGWCITDNPEHNTLENYLYFTNIDTDNPYSERGSLAWGSIDWNEGNLINNKQFLVFANDDASSVNTEDFSMKSSILAEKNKTIVNIDNRIFTKVNSGFTLAGYYYNGEYTGPLLVGKTAESVEIKNNHTNTVFDTPSPIYYSISTKEISETEMEGFEKFYWNGGMSYWMGGNRNASSSDAPSLRKLKDGQTVLNALKELLDRYFANFIYFPVYEEFDNTERYSISNAGIADVNSNNYHIVWKEDENFPEALKNSYTINYCYTNGKYFLCGYTNQDLMQNNVIIPIDWDGKTDPPYFSFDNVLKPTEITNWNYSETEQKPVIAINTTPSILGVNGEIVAPAGVNATYNLFDPEKLGTERKWRTEDGAYYITYTQEDGKWVISIRENPTNIADALFYINAENVENPYIDTENSHTWTIVNSDIVTVNGDVTVIMGEATPPYKEFSILDFPYNEVNGYYRSVDLEKDTELYNQMMTMWNWWWGYTLSEYYAFAKVENGDMVCFVFNNNNVVFIRKEYLNNQRWDSFSAQGSGTDWNILPRNFEEYYSYGGTYTINRSWVDGEL